MLYSTQRGDKQVVKVIKGGYLRQYADGKIEQFNVKVDVSDQGVDPSHKRILKGVYKVSKLVDPIHHATVLYNYSKNGLLET
ncbi:hypothetical protein, partial [Pseudomonas sp. FW306-02-H05-AA]|uniref:hypothetical protein n=1 Tax=Pseudomonas sp. FW306-02-H05-AA TaxID=2070657 RepID=UPI000CB48E79